MLKTIKPRSHLTKRIISLLAALALALPIAVTATPVTVQASYTDTSGYPKAMVANYDEVIVYGKPDGCVYIQEFYAGEGYECIRVNQIGTLTKGTPVTVTGLYIETTNSDGSEMSDSNLYKPYYMIEYNGGTGYVSAGANMYGFNHNQGTNALVAATSTASSTSTSTSNSATNWAAIADAWEAAGVEDYAAVIRGYYVDKTLTLADMDADQAAALIGAAFMVTTTNSDDYDYDAYAEAHVDEYESYDFDYLMDDEATAIADAIIAQVITDSMSEYEKVIAIYNWMRANISYDHAGIYKRDYGNDPDATSEDRLAKDVLVTGTAVCEGYADTFHMFMDKIGISCIEIGGPVTWANDDAHTWNMVKIDNQWYHVDVTNGRFLLSDDSMTALGYTGWRQIHSCPSNYGE